MSKPALPVPRPLFDTLDNIDELPGCVSAYLEKISVPDVKNEFNLCGEFLKSYANSKDTYSAYRRETERLLHWAWLVAKKPLKQLSRNDIRDYLSFIHEPPKNW